MSDGIYTAETGLAAFEAGLQSISNDTSNMNTPGYKGSGVLFADLVGGGNDGSGGAGEGVTTLGTAMNFSAGQLQSTGNPLDLAISGNGYFTLRDSHGNLHYTQDGQFQFNSDGVLVSSATKEDVMALDASGNLVPISIADVQKNPTQATTTVTLQGNVLNSTAAVTVSGVTVVDSAGTTHTLSLTLTPSTANTTSTTGTTWTVSMATDSATPPMTLISPLTLQYNAAGVPLPSADSIIVQYTAANSTTPTNVTLDFSGTTSTTTAISTTAPAVAFKTQDGFAPDTSSLTGETFDGTGTLILNYQSGQSVNGPQLALANFNSPDDVKSISSNEFAATNSGMQVGYAQTGTFGTIEAGEIEGSNVDLSQEFSNLVIMQRGYQACSQVISTASDMLSSLFDMVVK